MPSQSDSLQLVRPDWPLPADVEAVVTTRNGGISEGGYATLNLATHVGDDFNKVLTNRQQLQAALGLPRQPLWLEQVHGVAVAQVGVDQESVTADAAVSIQPGSAAAVLTADCLPVLFCGLNLQGQRVVAAAHAGWRGLAAGVLEQTLQRMQCAADQVSCWLGPAIGPQAFQVGAEVRTAFLDWSADATAAFVPDTEGKYRADLYQLATLKLQAAGVSQIFGGDFCTVNDDRFFSYRGAGSDVNGSANPCGRFASLIWIREG